MPVKIAAIITGDTSPRITWRISSIISSWKISRCSMVRCRASCGVMAMVSGSGAVRVNFQDFVQLRGLPFAPAGIQLSQQFELSGKQDSAEVLPCNTVLNFEPGGFSEADVLENQEHQFVQVANMSA